MKENPNLMLGGVNCLGGLRRIRESWEKALVLKSAHRTTDLLNDRG